MIAPLYAILLGAAGLVSALPTVDKRVVTALNTAAFNEAQQRDGTATRAFSAVQIKTGTGQCLFVDELSGDFRANLTPIQVKACDSSAGQQWDILTSGKHNNVAGAMLIVSSLTQACANFDDRRAAGNQVLLFSCGGRGDGSGQVTNSQLFPFSGSAGPQALSPENAAGKCFTVKGNVVDIATCNAADPNQQFSFGSGGAAAGTVAAAASNTIAATAATAASTTSAAATESAQAIVACGAAPVVDTSTAVAAAVSVAFTTSAAATSVAATTAAATAAAAATTAATQAAKAAGSPTGVVSVSRAGVVLNPSAAAEANIFDATATRAFTGVQVKSANGQCLFIDPTAGDFRENLIPIQLRACDGSAGTKFDFITAGKHNNAPNSALVVSSVTNGCLNFDNRRAAGDTVITFSCGGRADGQGAVTNSQLFTFTAGQKSLRLQPENGNGAVCLVPNASGRLDQAACSTDPGQLFTIG